MIATDSTSKASTNDDGNDAYNYEFSFADIDTEYVAPYEFTFADLDEDYFTPYEFTFDEIDDDNSIDIYYADIIDEINFFGDCSVNFLLDNAATTHVINDRSLFSKSEKVNMIVNTINGPDKINEKGTIKIDNLVLTDVLYAPHSKRNIVSLPKILKKPGYSWSGNNNKIIIKHGNKIVTAAKAREDSMFQLSELHGKELFSILKFQINYKMKSCKFISHWVMLLPKMFKNILRSKNMK